MEIHANNPTICIRKAAFERSTLTRDHVDGRYNLTTDEFRVEGDLVVVGPLQGDGATELLRDLEAAGLEYYDDFIELSGNWPDWLRLYAYAPAA